ncbi:MAG: polyprenyl glycosylphosphotransferase [Bacteroidetes bacterium 4572_114]|nr:MAG: polyprenyl glycosylphosphotransferase [Bacteroidetes bacterium 4572_114]
MNRQLQRIRYIFADWVSAVVAWTLFFMYRKFSVLPDHFSLVEVFTDVKFYFGIIIIPLFWLILYVIAGYYRKVFRKSRVKELSQIFSTTIVGVTIIFFTLILDDVVVSYRSYLQSFLVLFGLQFVITAVSHLVITTRTVKKVHNKIIGFNTVIVGSSDNAVKMFLDLDKQFPSSGNKFIGFVNAKKYDQYKLAEYLPHLGYYKDLPSIIKDNSVEEVIIAVERLEHELVENVIAEVENTTVVIKIIPIMQDFLMGAVKTTAIFGEPLIQVSPDLMPAWQESLKRLIDIVASLVAVTLLLPVYAFLAIGVKRSSNGPIFYSQERIGLNGKPFNIHKFRSMYIGAEKGTPQLSSTNDNRITRFGKMMRKLRLDETPQFYTVLKGDMSLVGPRPERQFFIDQIMKKAPHYRLLQRVKPGITSWGQVKFGYASNVDEMIKRLKFDILYVENMSLAMDFKIMAYTIIIVLQGSGK